MKVRLVPGLLVKVVARLLTISNDISQNSDYLYAYQQVDLMLWNKRAASVVVVIQTPDDNQYVKTFHQLHIFYCYI